MVNLLQGHFSASLPQQERRRTEFLNETRFSEVMDQSGRLHDVKGARELRSCGLVVVSVNGENRHGDGEVGIVNVRGKDSAGSVHVDELKALRFVPDAVLSQQLHRAVHDRSRQFVFVEQVSPREVQNPPHFDAQAAEPL